MGTGFPDHTAQKQAYAGGEPGSQLEEPVRQNLLPQNSDSQSRGTGFPNEGTGSQVPSASNLYTNIIGEPGSQLEEPVPRFLLFQNFNLNRPHSEFAIITIMNLS